MRQPVHTLYGGAHLFNAGTCAKMGRLAVEAITKYGVPAEFEPVRDRVCAKLLREPLEDFRIDFEDGYGARGDAEEDGDAVRVGGEVRRCELPPFFGIRLKPIGERALRTLALFLEAMGRIPDNFIVTLPKIERPEEVERLAEALPNGRIEVMIETPAAVMNPRAVVDAARGRCSGAHFGVYDYAASLGIAAANGMMRHPACDFARNMMQVGLAGTGVFLADGVTSTLPVGTREDVHAAWKLHYDDVRRSMANGFYQSWDLHPAQLVSRYAAVYSFYRESLEANAARLRNFREKQARATLVGSAFDDQATVRVLEIYFARAVDSGAITQEEADALTSPR